MVGTVVYKDFETGSYRYMRISAYNGMNYTDIGKGEFYSCRVCPEVGDIRLDYEAPKGAPRPNMDDIMKVAVSAREFFFENPFVTVADYRFVNGENSLKVVSSKAGVYEPVDYHSLFNNGGFYKLISETRDKTPLFRSVLCDMLNCALQLICGVSERIFSFSGYGIYINMAVFEKRALIAMGIGRKLSKIISNKNTCRLKLDDRKNAVFSNGYMTAKHYRERIINKVNFCKKRCTSRVSELLDKCTCSNKAAEVVCSLACDECINEYADSLAEELSEFAEFYYDMGYLEAKSHKDMLTFREVMLLCSNGKYSEETRKAAAARSANIKFMNKLPCAPFYDNDGRAIWDTEEY